MTAEVPATQLTLVGVENKMAADIPPNESGVISHKIYTNMMTKPMKNNPSRCDEER